MKDFVVRKQLTVRAPASQVWRALTDGTITRQYFFGCRVESGWDMGDSIVFKKKILGIFPVQFAGEILAIDDENLLQYSLGNSRSSTDSVVTIDLYEDFGNTVVSVSDAVGTGTGAADRYKRSVKGWDKVLLGLKKVVETELD